jgi:hypothetical protein
MDNPSKAKCTSSKDIDHTETTLKVISSNKDKDKTAKEISMDSHQLQAWHARSVISQDIKRTTV